MSHWGCHSRGAEQVQLQKSTGEIPFRAEGGKKKRGQIQCKSPLLPSPLSLPPSLCRALSSVCCCQSEEQAVEMWPLPLCFSECMCASPSSMLRGRQRTSALNSPLTPPSSPLSFSPSYPPPSQLTSTLRGLLPKYQARLSRYLESIE